MLAMLICNRNLRRVSLFAALGVQALAPARAHALSLVRADVKVASDLVEDRPFDVTVTELPPLPPILGQPNRYYVFLLSAREAVCEPGRVGGVIDEFEGPAPGSLTNQMSAPEPGSYVVCAQLVSASMWFPSFYDSRVFAVSAVPVTVRENRPTLSAQVTPVALPGEQVAVALSGSTEARRMLVYAISGSESDCDMVLATSGSGGFFGLFDRRPASASVDGAFTVTPRFGAFDVAATYTLCARLQDAGIPEATASAVLEVSEVAVVRSLRMSPARFRASRSGPSVGYGGGGGTSTRLEYELIGAPGTVRFRVSARRRGRCDGRPCIRYVPVKGSFTDDGRPRRNDVYFTGRIGGRRLRPGRYRLSARSESSPATARRNFRIIK